MNNNKTVTVSGVVSLILALLGVLNFTLSAIGITPVPVDAESINLFITTIFTLVGIIGTVWNNFNMTNAAKIGDTLVDKIKAGEIDYNQAEQLIRDLVETTNEL